MRAKEYDLIDRCVADGVQRGWNRAHKHTDTPDEIFIRDQIYQAVMTEISEWFDFNTGENTHE